MLFAFAVIALGSEVVITVAQGHPEIGDTSDISRADRGPEYVKSKEQLRQGEVPDSTGSKLTYGNDDVQQEGSLQLDISEKDTERPHREACHSRAFGEA